MGGAGLNRTHLWLNSESGEILGYFALTPTVVTYDLELKETAPALLLAKMALCENLRGSKPPVGPSLLLEVFDAVVRAADIVGGRFLAVDTKHDRAFRFYASNGFTPIEGSTSSLIIKISTLKRLLA